MPRACRAASLSTFGRATASRLLPRSRASADRYHSTSPASRSTCSRSASVSGSVPRSRSIFLTFSATSPASPASPSAGYTGATG